MLAVPLTCELRVIVLDVVFDCNVQSPGLIDKAHVRLGVHKLWLELWIALVPVANIGDLELASQLLHNIIFCHEDVSSNCVSQDVSLDPEVPARGFVRCQRIIRSPLPAC